MINLDKLIFYLKKTLVNKCLLTFENNNMIDPIFSNLNKYNNINNFSWIKINGFIYTINHFKKYFNLINCHCFSYRKFNELNINSSINIDIFSIYFIFSCFLNNINISNNDNYLLLKNVGNNNLIIYNSKANDKEMSISYDKETIKKIYRNNYLVYNNKSLNLYCTPELFINKKNDMIKLSNKKLYLLETLQDLPIFILNNFIKTCLFLIKQYPILSDYKNIKTIHSKINTKNLIKLIWTTSWKEINFSHLKKKFNIIILCNTQDNLFRTAIYYNTLYCNFSPFSDKIYSLYYQIENSKIFYLPNTLQLIPPKNKIYILNIIFLIIIMISFFLKNIIRNDYDNITYLKTSIKCDNIYQFIDNFIDKYFNHRMEIPLIILWDPNPRFYYYQNGKNKYDNNSYYILKKILSLLGNFRINFIKQKILNIYLYEHSLWGSNLKFNSHNNKCKQQHLVFNKYKNVLEIKGNCLFSVRKIIDFLVYNNQTIENK